MSLSQDRVRMRKNEQLSHVNFRRLKSDTDYELLNIISYTCKYYKKVTVTE